MNAIRDFVIDKLPVGIIAFDQKLNVIFSNRKAQLFLKRHQLPDEIRTLCKRIFDSINASKLRETFPGDILLFKGGFDEYTSRWSFKLCICEESEPFVAVYILEESLTDKINMNEVRGRFKLTRRETDVLGCVLRSLRNTDIAEELEISVQTVKDHMSSICMKLEVKNRFELRKRIF